MTVFNTFGDCWWYFQRCRRVSLIWTIVIVISAVCVSAAAQQCSDGPMCSYMASQGECEMDPEYMLQDCPRACKNPCICGPTVSNDTACDCLIKAKEGYCNTSGATVDCATTCANVQHESCPPLALPNDPNAHLSTYSTQYLTTVTEICNKGYQSVYTTDQGMRTCAKDGKWVKDWVYGNPVSCELIDCGKPPATDYTFNYALTTTVGSTAEYTCRSGYVADKGQTTLTCNATGYWEGEPLTCKKKPIDCGQPPPSPNTTVNVGNTTVGSTANYTCAVGYKVANGQTTLTCNSNGLWDGELLKCSKIDCGQPPNIINTNTKINGTFYEDTANYACADGFVYVQGNTTLTCGSTGDWEGDVIQCREINCGPPPTSPHANVTSQGTYWGDMANYTCVTGYELSQGGTTLTCGDSEKWEGLLIVCEVIDCNTPPSLPHTSVQVDGTTYGKTANYTCVTGYTHAQGQSTLICGSSGTWIGNSLLCKMIDCQAPPSHKSLTMSVGETTYQQEAKYSCNVGYEYVSGNTTLVCDHTGSWSGVLMTCVEKDCGVPNVRNLSDVTYSSTTYGSRAVYSCDVGHERVDGDVVRICQDDETWSGNAIVCLSVVCGPPPIFAGARMWTLEGEGHHKYGDKIHYECFYEEEGREGLQWVLECGPDKEWVGKEPECGAANPDKPDDFEADPKEAPASWAIGVGIFSVLASFIVLFIILDVATLKKHSKYMKSNVKNFKKGVQKRWSSFKVWASWTPTDLTRSGLMSLSPSASTSPHLSPSHMSHQDSTSVSQSSSVSNSVTPSALSGEQILTTSPSSVSIALSQPPAGTTMTSTVAWQ